jgi:UDP-glucose 4-epimerase
MRILVTGGAGFIGSNLCAALSARGIATTAIDAFRPHSVMGDRVATTLHYRRNTLLVNTRVIAGDLLDKSALRDVLSRVRPDCVVHLAGLAVIPTAERDFEAAHSDILQSTINLFEGVRLSPQCSRVVHISSSMVYGHFAGDSINEDAPLAPINVYGELKRDAELVARMSLEGTGVESVVVRPSAVYGPGEASRRVVQTFCENALAGLPITVNGSASSVLDFTYVDDLCDGLYRAATMPAAAGEIFNMTSGRPRSLSALIECIRRHCPALKLNIDEPRDAFRPIRGALDIGRARRLLGYAPQSTLESGIARYMGHLYNYRPVQSLPEHCWEWVDA